MLSLRLLAEVRLSSDSIRVDTTLSESNSEESFLTPVFTPRVGDDPVFNTIFFTPTNNLDGVSTQKLSTSVGVDTSSVVHEIFINFESSVNRTVLHEVSLDRSGVLQGSNR